MTTLLSSMHVDLLPLIMQCLSDGLVVVDQDGKFLLFNPAAERMLGSGVMDCAPDEWSRRYGLFLPDQTTPYPTRDLPLSRALRGEEVNEAELFVRHEGRPAGVWLSINARPLKNGEGTASGAVAVFRDVTVHKQFEEALRQAEARYHSLVEGLNLTTWQKDTQGRFTFGNASFCKTLGKPIRDLLGKTDYDCFPLELAEKYRHDDERVMQTGEIFEDIEEFLTAEGEKRYIQVLKAPLKDAYGRVVGTQGLLWNVTARREAEEALRDSEARYHSLVESLPLNIFRKDLAGRLTFGNELYYRTLGKEPAELLGKTDFDLFPRELAEKYRRDDERVIESGGVWEDVEEHLMPAGDLIYVQVLKAPLYDARGEIVGIQGIFWDVTERKRADQALRESREHYARILATANDAFVGMDTAGLISEWNEQAETIFGRKREDVLGRPLHELIIPPQYRELHQRGLARYLETGEGPVLNRRIEVSALKSSGEEFPVELTVWPIQVGGTVKFNAFVHDITERKRVEAQLQRAKEAAEAANQAKSLFLANMSHEIRTPMNGIIGLTELLLGGELAPGHREYLELVRESAESLMTVINDILDFSKIEAGKLELDCLEFSLRDKLGDALKSLAFRAHGRGLELACHIRSDVPDALIGDAGRLRQVVVNLVGNAIKFTEVGEVVVGVAVEERSEEDVLLAISVRDTGVGIPAEKRELIFAAFEQADNTTSRKYGGTGLGLSIASRLVQLMGGRIWVESEPSRGSTFHCRARFGLGTEGAGLGPVEPSYLIDLPVLVVDDNPTNRLILVEMLSNWKMRPTAVEGARSGLAALRQAAALGEPYSLVLTDVHMPEMDGLEFARLVADDPALNRPTVIALSSAGVATGGVAGRPAGIAFGLMKPVKQSELFDAIIETLGKASGQEPLAETTAAGGPCDRRLKILLAEDNPVNQKLAVRLLENRGHVVSVAGNGRDALDRLAREEFDVVLMDVQMPDMDGLEATAAIRRREEGGSRRVPIVAMTAHAMKGDRERCLAAGMDGYVSKPIRAAELWSTVEELGGGCGSRAENAARAPAILDRGTALAAVGGDTELLAELIDVYRSAAGDLIGELRGAVGAGDAKRLQRAAHSLKGAVGHFGAERAFGLAMSLETLAQDGKLADADAAVESLVDELSRLEPALGTLLEQAPGEPA